MSHSHIFKEITSFGHTERKYRCEVCGAATTAPFPVVNPYTGVIEQETKTVAKHFVTLGPESSVTLRNPSHYPIRLYVDPNEALPEMESEGDVVEGIRAFDKTS